MISGAAMLVSFILIGFAGDSPHSALAATGGGLIVVAILGALVCAVAALWRRIRRDKRDELGQLIPGSQNAPAYPYLPTKTNGTMPYPGRSVASDQWRQQQP
jgi:hypothetical protein